MQARAAFRFGAGSTCLFAAAGAIATPPIGPAPAPQAPEVMLYISRPIGAGSGGFRLPNLSLRFEQARMGANSGSPAAGDPMQHRELFRLEIAGPRTGYPLDMRLGLGGRVSYDLKRGVFGVRRPDAKPGPPR